MPSHSNCFSVSFCKEIVRFEFAHSQNEKFLTLKCPPGIKTTRARWHFRVATATPARKKYGPTLLRYDKRRSTLSVRHGNLYFLTLNLKTRKGTVKVSKSPRIFFWLVKAVFYAIGLKKRCLFFHGATLAKNERCAYLFLGHSGMGKTTLCRHAKEKWHVFSDELGIIVPRKNEFYAHESPFFRPFTSRKGLSSASIQKIFILSKGKKRNAWKTIGKERSLERLMPYLFFPFNAPEFIPERLATLRALSQHLTIKDLRLFSFPNFLRALERGEP